MVTELTLFQAHKIQETPVEPQNGAIFIHNHHWVVELRVDGLGPDLFNTPCVEEHRDAQLVKFLLSHHFGHDALPNQKNEQEFKQVLAIALLARLDTLPLCKGPQVQVDFAEGLDQYLF